mmetsp:Transcript_93372/g.194819  ORF Transcript_93372/g.194819 Transcript_93372/m.194819 type:complete len:541 (-) Transcript_93372:87-1709(-)
MLLIRACVFVQLCVIFAFNGHFCHGSRQSGEACESTMNTNLQTWLDLSGGPSRYNRPDWSDAEWRNVMDDYQIRKQSEGVAIGCQIAGGRMWEIGLTLGATKANFTVCAPAICNHSEASDIVAYAFVKNAVAKQGTSHYRQLPWTQEDLPHVTLTTLEELGTWSSIPLDFALIGIHGCGTTSMFRNLLQHPQIDFTSVTEDYDIWDRNLLPSVAYVESMKKRREAFPAGQHMLLGQDNPHIWKLPLVMSALDMIPGVKVIMLLCDPVRIFEKFWWHTSAEAKIDPPAPATAWWKLARQILKDRGGALFANEVSWLRNVAKIDSIVAHISHFREHPRETYQRLTSFLGVEEFPPEHVFRKFNTWDRRVGFCQNHTMIRRMRRLFDADYRTIVTAVSWSGWPITREISSRILQCEATKWECGAAFMDQFLDFNAVSGGLVTSAGAVALGDSRQEAAIAECDSMGGVAWHVKFQHASMGKEGDVSICAPAICDEVQVRDGVSHHVFKSQHNPRGLDRPLPVLLLEDFTDLIVEVKSKMHLPGG